jgi:hypothetical protein
MRTVDRFIADPAASYGCRIEPATYEDAEQVTGFRLDRRLNYVITEESEVEARGVVTLNCTGCSCGCEGGCGPSTGCGECGYTGKRRMHFTYPV